MFIVKTIYFYIRCTPAIWWLLSRCEWSDCEPERQTNPSVPACIIYTVLIGRLQFQHCFCLGVRKCKENPNSQVCKSDFNCLCYMLGQQRVVGADIGRRWVSESWVCGHTLREKAMERITNTQFIGLSELTYNTLHTIHQGPRQNYNYVGSKLQLSRVKITII